MLLNIASLLFDRNNKFPEENKFRITLIVIFDYIAYRAGTYTEAVGSQP
jgi:hypothetical protein